MGKHKHLLLHYGTYETGTGWHKEETGQPSTLLGEHLPGVLDALSEHGWEVVGVGPDPNGNNTPALILRRST